MMRGIERPGVTEATARSIGLAEVVGEGRSQSRPSPFPHILHGMRLLFHLTKRLSNRPAVPGKGVSMVREERAPEARLEVMNERVGTIITADEVVLQERPTPRGARLDRIK